MINNGAVSPSAPTVDLKKGPWSKDEDDMLRAYVEMNGEGNWNSVQRNSGLKRCGKSCRLRWANHLRGSLKKTPFSPYEEQFIVEHHAKFGNKWARMAAQLPGRTDNEIKNFWNTRLKRRLRAGQPIYDMVVPDMVNMHQQPIRIQPHLQPQPQFQQTESSFSSSSFSSLPYTQMLGPYQSSHNNYETWMFQNPAGYQLNREMNMSYSSMLLGSVDSVSFNSDDPILDGFEGISPSQNGTLEDVLMESRARATKAQEKEKEEAKVAAAQVSSGSPSDQSSVGMYQSEMTLNCEDDLASMLQYPGCHESIAELFNSTGTEGFAYDSESYNEVVPSNLFNW